MIRLDILSNVLKFVNECKQIQMQTEKKYKNYLSEPFMLPFNKTSVRNLPSAVCTSTFKCSKALIPILLVP